MQMMQNKLDAQESRLNTQGQEQTSASSGLSVRAVAHEISDSIIIGGAIEVVANHTDSDGWSNQDASDLVLDTFELGIEASAGDWVNGSILFLYEDDTDDSLLVDEAYITFANADVTPFYANVGRLYVPFGNFESNMISDPATLTIGETRAELVQLGFEVENGIYGSAYVFNGDAEEVKNNYAEQENNHIDNYGMNLGYVIEYDDISVDFGAGYINNIASSGGLAKLVDSNALCADGGCIKEYVGGLSLHAIASFGSFSLIGEYITALEDFEANELTGDHSDKLKPRAWNIEGAYSFELASKEATFALGYQKTKDMHFDTETTDFFEKAWLTSLSVGIIDNTILSAEWKHSDAYKKVKNTHRAAGDKYGDEDLLQVKLSYEF
jgi:hypothetical protein